MIPINIDSIFKKNEIQIRELNFSTKLKAKDLSMNISNSGENIDVLEEQVQKYLSENVDRSFLSIKTEGNEIKFPSIASGGITSVSSQYRSKYL